MNTVSNQTQKLVGTAVLIAVIIVLQTAFGSIQLGPFTITLTMVPIIIGAVLYGPLTGALLGAVFGIVVVIQVITGAAGAGSTMMLTMNVPATVILCILKGLAAGLVAGAVASGLGKKHLFAGIIAAAVVAPICNTGIFTAGLVTIFAPLAQQWAEGAGASSVWGYILAGIIGVNFVIELIVDVVMAPIILRIIQAVRASK